MANREEEEATFQGDNQGIEPQKKSKSSQRDKSRGRDPSVAPVSEGLTHEEAEGDRNRSSPFRKDYEERKKGVNHRDGCICAVTPLMCTETAQS
ncbi:hypothetical protein HAX54_047606 [Datura stramonium]|uniref:Uncharacterized protein n=1 Tax=Datura stramonium TaxID=4076 RepID=A0ABS8WKG2_DATST|nr:hypothetical protein [Datura stramonium]